MKKIFLLLAFAGMVGAISATAFKPAAQNAVNSVKQDDKNHKAKKDSTHHDCSKHEKGKCCKMKSDSTHHDCSKHEKGKCDKMKSDSTHHDCSKHPKGKCEMHKKDSTKTK